MLAHLPAYPQRKRATGQRIPVKFILTQRQLIPIRLSTPCTSPQLIFIVSANPARLALVAGLFKLAGHQTVPVSDPKAVSALVWKTPPDLILVDIALREEDRRRLRSEVEGRAVASKLFVVESSMDSIGVDDQMIRVNGHVIRCHSPGEPGKAAFVGKAGQTRGCAGEQFTRL